MTQSSANARTANTRTAKRTLSGRLLLAGFALATLVEAAPAAAQMSESPWQFRYRDRAGLAVVMKQAEDASSNSGGLSGGSSAVSADTTVLVCGGESASTATSNSSCIILNNATGDLSIGQDSLGDQNATNAASTTSVDAVEQILQSSAGTPE